MPLSFSDVVSECGFKSVPELCEITQQSRRTLYNWAGTPNKHTLLHVFLVGAVTLKHAKPGQRKTPSVTPKDIDQLLTTMYRYRDSAAL